MLNRGKGPAVHSLRAQIDRRKYSTVMKHKLELQENLELRQAEIVEIEKTEDGYDLTTRMLAVFHCKTVVIATGTYLGGRILWAKYHTKAALTAFFLHLSLVQVLKTRLAVKKI